MNDTLPPSAKGMHDSAADPRNAAILIDVNGTLKPRDEAMVSVFDSGFMLGDGVWEGLRVHAGRIAFLSTGCSRAPRRSRWISASRARCWSGGSTRRLTQMAWRRASTSG